MGEIQRGEIWWADLPAARRSEPAYRRPVLVVQADSFNRSRIHTVIVAVITSNLALAQAPGKCSGAARLDSSSRPLAQRVGSLGAGRGMARPPWAAKDEFARGQ